MRLRSSQFVFLLLLLCSVQWTEGLAHPLAEVVAGSTRDAANGQVLSSQPSRQNAVPSADAGASPHRDAGPGPASAAIARTPQTMRQPALQAASVTSHTGLLRA